MHMFWKNCIPNRHPLPHLHSAAVVLAIALAGVAGAARLKPQDTAEAHLGKGYDALRQDRYDAAVAEFRAALRSIPRW
jgi:hypothetical protein